MKSLQETRDTSGTNRHATNSARVSVRYDVAEGWCLLLKRGRGEASKTSKAAARGAQPCHVKPQTLQPPLKSLRRAAFAVEIVDNQNPTGD
jgi:hypothetical protein